MSKLSIIDKGTGEIYGDYEPKSGRIKRSRDYYALMFMKNIAKANLSITACESCILIEMDKENKLSLTPAIKGAMLKAYGYSNNKIKITLTRMVKRGIMIRISNNLYFVNPYLISKANLNKVEALRAGYAEMSLLQSKKAVKKPDIVDKVKSMLKKQANGI